MSELNIRNKVIYSGRLFPVRSNSPRAPKGTLRLTISEPGEYQVSVWDMSGKGYDYYTTTIQKLEQNG